MRNTSINREILSLAIPSIVTNITTPLLGLVDVAIVGHMGAAAYIGAIAVGGTMFNMLYWLFGFLRMGSSGMTAQCYGSGDKEGASRILEQALLVAFIAGAIMIALRHPVCDAVLWFMDVDATTAQLARTYFLILIWGAPAVLGNYVMCGWLLGMQNSKATMWISIFINLCNIVVSCTFVYALRFNIPGVAYGTLFAQWAGFLLAASIALLGYDIIPCTLRELCELKGLKRFFRINGDIFLRTLCLVTVTIWFTRTGARQGEEKICRWGLLVAAIFTIIYTIGCDLLLQLLSDDNRVVTHAHEYLYWVITIPVAGFLAFTWDGIFIGATATRDMLMSMACATAIFFAVYFIAYPSLGNHGLWLAFICYLLTRSAILTVIGRRYL